MATTFSYASCFILLHLLILLSFQGGWARELSERRGGEKSMDHHHLSGSSQKDDHGGEAVHHDHDHAKRHHMDPSIMIFFTVGDLKKGKAMPIYFPKRDPLSSPHLLPREEAESIPFSSNRLPHLLRRFSFSDGSPQAQAMEATLTHCESDPVEGETKTCATSLESMLDFVRRIFADEFPHFRAISTKHLTSSNTHFQNYTILEEPIELPAPRMVPCHSLPYPYAVFYCHSQDSVNKVFEVVLGGENGDKVNAVAACHFDTSHWSRDHMSFLVLGIEPGTAPVCHFFPADNLVWVPVAPSHSAM